MLIVRITHIDGRLPEEHHFLADTSIVIGRTSALVVQFKPDPVESEIAYEEGAVISVRNWGN